MFTDIYDRSLMLTPQEYLEFYSKSKDEIEKVEFVYPEIGQKNFGCFKVSLKNNLASEYGKHSTKRFRVN